MEAVNYILLTVSRVAWWHTRSILARFGLNQVYGTLVSAMPVEDDGAAYLDTLWHNHKSANDSRSKTN